MHLCTDNSSVSGLYVACLWWNCPFVMCVTEPDVILSGNKLLLGLLSSTGVRRAVFKCLCATKTLQISTLCLTAGPVAFMVWR